MMLSNISVKFVVIISYVDDWCCTFFTTNTLLTFTSVNVKPYALNILV